MTRALVLAAPTSGAGKTVISLGLMRALADRGIRVRAAKSGPDYIDPAFHAVATGAPSVNLDAWAMEPGDLRARATAQGGELLLVEGAMGVLDGASDGTGSVAELAVAIGAPVVLIVDAARVGHSAALAPAGLRALRPDLPLAGVILNRVGSDRHAALSAQEMNVPIFGALPRDPGLELPSRHLGLVQAVETAGLEGFIAHAGDLVSRHIDLDAMIAASLPIKSGGTVRRMPPIGRRIAVARDVAFAFAYPHLLDDWQAAGTEVVPFSPLGDQAPDPLADAVFLPGGYPELHAGTLAAASTFRAGMTAAAARGAVVYGECGGYMVLGEAMEDADGNLHPMLGLLPVSTSFAHRRLTLGYRRLKPLGGPFAGPLAAHEFHYASVVSEGAAERLFKATDASGTALPDMGLRKGTVSGSFAHVIAAR